MNAIGIDTESDSLAVRDVGDESPAKPAPSDKAFYFAVEFHPNKAMCSIHTSCKLPSFSDYPSSLDKTTEEGKSLRQAVLDVEGVVNAHCGTFNLQSMTIHRGGVYLWDDVLPRVVAAIAKNLGLDGTYEVKLYA